MTKFLVKASYTSEGIKGLLKVGGTKRKQTVEKTIAEMGGKMEAFYFGFGEHDAYVIAEMPDNASVAALALNINATGVVSVSTTVLLSAEDIDKAVKLTVHYQTPGN
jgi:uncharacterized protein with GYD domain